MNEKETKSILFLCTGNACRSQMAEGFARKILPKNWKIYSAGIMAAGLHPLTIQAMQEVGIDISDQRSKSVDEIPKDEIERLFDRFFSRSDGGTGLGLAIVKKILDDHDGLISVNSEEGVGTTFTVSIPVW